MKKILLLMLCIFGLMCELLASEKLATTQNAYAVKIDGQISPPQLFIVKRAIRMASSEGIKILAIDMDTPGGDLDTTLKIMQALRDFDGQTICYINPNAISAGSFIATSCDKIYFSPEGVMGAAEAVNATGSDIDKSMQRKITSFLGAKVRAISGENQRRADVQRAMNDPDFELKIGKKIIKKKGELLTLTAKEASEIIDGKPLLSDGTAKTLADALKLATGDNIKIKSLKITWAEKVAKYISAISPILMGLGFMLIFIDIKSGGFGILGGLGVGVLLIVFVGANLSGIAGYEEIIVFAIGAILVAIEIFFLQGTIFLALIGGALMLGSLAWALGDMLPSRSFDYNSDAFLNGFAQVGMGLIIAITLTALLWKFLPETRFMKNLILQTQKNSDENKADKSDSPIGKIGIALTDFMPSGKVDIDGKIIEATALFGHIRTNDKVEIVGKKDFNFTAKRVDS